ncbi:hypothetical protein [Enterovirga sp. CN4-39]|uniref:hypothetical protein n=1 Tax=Enterovirga sp. CN4-39 TaxID=3400910 RepID=UPI003C0240CF
MNRALYGPKWASHKDELLWSFAFLEKPDRNPHWHLLIRLYDHDLAVRNNRITKLEVRAAEIWQKLVPSGTADVRRIVHGHDRVASYVAKELGHELQYADFVTPDEFRRLL